MAAEFNMYKIYSKFKRSLLTVGILLLSAYGYAQNPDIAQLVQLKKGFEENPYPQTKGGKFNFTIINPGIAIVPVGGGAYMAGWKRWFIPPQDDILPYSADYLQSDSSLYLVTISKTKCMVIKTSSTIHGPGCKKVLEMPDGNYSLKVITPDFIWLWGTQNGVNCVWKYENKELKLFFISPQAISDLIAINHEDIVVATKNTIITMGLKHSAREIIKINSAIDGLALHNDGTLFVSTENGILHYQSAEQEDEASVVTYGIHGKLRRFGNNLYVLWKEDNQVLKIKL